MRVYRHVGLGSRVSRDSYGVAGCCVAALRIKVTFNNSVLDATTSRMSESDPPLHTPIPTVKLWYKDANGALKTVDTGLRSTERRALAQFELWLLFVFILREHWHCNFGAWKSRITMKDVWIWSTHEYLPTDTYNKLRMCAFLIRLFIWESHMFPHPVKI